MAALDERLERYAELAVRIGVNVTEGQTVFITARVEHSPFARALTRASYAAGARYVDVFYTDQHAFMDRYDLAGQRRLQGVCSWILGYEDPAIWPALPKAR